jgi:hypothetical protein
VRFDWADTLTDPKLPATGWFVTTGLLSAAFGSLCPINDSGTIFTVRMLNVFYFEGLGTSP